MKRTITVFLALMTGIFSLPVLAQEQFSGFLDNYEQLEPAEDVWLNYVYTGPDFRPKVAGTTAFMLEQPEIFIAPD